MWRRRSWRKNRWWWTTENLLTSFDHVDRLDGESFGETGQRSTNEMNFDIVVIVVACWCCCSCCYCGIRVSSCCGWCCRGVSWHCLVRSLEVWNILLLLSCSEGEIERKLMWTRDCVVWWVMVSHERRSVFGVMMGYSVVSLCNLAVCEILRSFVWIHPTCKNKLSRYLTIFAQSKISQCPSSRWHLNWTVRENLNKRKNCLVYS